MKSVDFLDGKALLVTDTELHQTLFDEVRERWNHYTHDAFPGPQPVSIERVHLDSLRNNYRVCEKSDGQRFLFVCSRYQGKPYCFVMNRKKDMYVLRFEIVTEAFKGTILDGEIILNKHTNRHEFLVYDSTMVCGRNTMDKTHEVRMTEALSVVQFIKTYPDSVFTVRLKSFYPFERFSWFVENVVPTLCYDIDGYVFTPNDDPVISGTHYRMFKWKEQHKNTVDFLIEPNHNKRSVHKYILKILKGKYLKVLFDNHVLVEPGHAVETAVLHEKKSVVVECEYIGPNTWKAIMIRHDKTTPNSYMTWTKTLLNIEENIQLKEFFEP
jgi:hypothetical protein